MIFGPPGTGKTCSVYAIANELGMELLEVNASDTRDKENIQKIVGSSSMQLSLFGKPKVILVDELDGITKDDFGGIPELVRIIEKTRFPLILVANDIEDQKFKPLIKISEVVEFTRIGHNEIFQLLKSICEKEKILYDEIALKILSTRAGGDVRAALIDLQTISSSGEKITREDVLQLSERQQEENIISSLIRIFKSTDPKVAVSAFENVDVDFDTMKLWVDYNLPLEYKSKDLANAYDCMSMADVYNKRIIRRQYWRLLNYINLFMTVGIAVAKESKNNIPVKYKKPMRLLQVWMANQKNVYRKRIAEKIAMHTHCSAKRAFKEVIYIKAAAKNKTYIKSISEALRLDEDEQEWLLR